MAEYVLRAKLFGNFVLNLSGETYTVVGVIRGRLPFFDPLSIDVFVPINLFDDPVFRDRKVRNGTYAVARLKPGLTLAQGRAEMDLTARNLAATYPRDERLRRAPSKALASGGRGGACGGRFLGVE